MKIFFAGTPDVAVPTLEALAHEHDVVGVLTRQDAPVGRKRILTASPVAVAAERLGLPIIKASRVGDDVLRAVTASGAELGVVVAYGALMPQETLDAVPHGWINLHFSRLPEWRGAAPLQRDIMSGSSEAHLSIFKLVAALDAGDVYECVAEPLGDDETAGQALARLSEIGSRRVTRVVDAIANGSAVAVAQMGEPSYAHKLNASDGHLSSDERVHDAYNRFRGVSPEPGAWIESTTGRVKIIDCLRRVESENNTSVLAGRISQASDGVLLGFADGSLALSVVQPAGKQAMPATDWFRGLHDVDNWRFE